MCVSKKQDSCWHLPANPAAAPHDLSPDVSMAKVLEQWELHLLIEFLSSPSPFSTKQVLSRGCVAVNRIQNQISFSLELVAEAGCHLFPV